MYECWGSGQYGDHLQPDPNFAVDITTKEDYKEVGPIVYNINWNTEGSKFDYRTGAGVLINNRTIKMTLLKKPFILVPMRLCLKLKVLQWEEQHPTLYSLKQKTKCCHK